MFVEELLLKIVPEYVVEMLNMIVLMFAEEVLLRMNVDYVVVLVLKKILIVMEIA